MLGGWLACALQAAESSWRPLFDGKTQAGWAATPFAGAGEVEVRDGTLVLNQGILTGVHWTNEFPTVDYELSLEAQRVLGIDFFCGLTFPVGDTHLTLVAGGWGGSVVGLSNIDGESANKNATTSLHRFESGKWYTLRLRVAATNIAVWLDREPVVDFDPRGHTLGLREGEIEMSRPLGIATWSTTAAYRKIRWRPLEAAKPAAAVLPDDTRAAMESLVRAATNNHAAWNRLAELCDTFGPRPTGSTNIEAALDWILARMKDDGLENVHGEPVKVPHWVRGPESAELLSPLGGTVATPPGGIVADVLVVTNFLELTNRAAEARGKIVLFDVPFTRYGDTVRYRWAGAVEAAKAGAVAGVVRSVGDYSLRTPHTGAMGYDTNVARIPTAAIAPEDAARIARHTARGRKVSMRLVLSGRSFPEATSRNVVAEIRGREFPDEIVVLGGHIDSWDVGQGAQDDGAGCVTVMAALDLLRQAPTPPRRTVRAVLYTNEENGLAGGKAYAAAHGREAILYAVEDDTGSGRPLGLGVEVEGPDGESDPVRAAAVAASLAPLAHWLAPLGAGEVGPGHSGADISPLLALGVVGLGLSHDMTGYWPVHHTDADTFDKVDPALVRENVAALATAAWYLAERAPDPRPARKPTIKARR